jgi:hypothetical protein
MTDLKLIALDAEDLSVLSAHLQDAVLKAGDLAYLPHEKRFAALLNRFDWATAATVGKTKRGDRRLQSAVRFERVLSAKLQGIDLKAKTQVLSLLAIGFEVDKAPGGTVTLIFAGGGAIRLQVECIEAELKDLGGAWQAVARPDHGETTQGDKAGGGGASKA